MPRCKKEKRKPIIEVSATDVLIQSLERLERGLDATCRQNRTDVLRVVELRRLLKQLRGLIRTIGRMNSPAALTLIDAATLADRWFKSYSAANRSANNLAIYEYRGARYFDDTV